MRNDHVIPVTIFAHEVVAVDGASILTASVYAPATGGHADYARIQVLTDKVWMYFDGTVADANGEQANVGDVIEIYGGHNIANFRAIKVTGAASLRVHYGRRQG